MSNYIVTFKSNNLNTALMSFFGKFSFIKNNPTVTSAGFGIGTAK